MANIVTDTCPECGHSLGEAAWNALEQSDTTAATGGLPLSVPFACPECRAKLVVEVTPQAVVKRHSPRLCSSPEYCANVECTGRCG